MTAILLLFAMTTALGPQAGSRPQPRDAGARLATGTGSVSGTVTRSGKPLRKARVTLNSTAALFNHTIVTDDTGRFLFERLPAGTYTLAAMKEGQPTVSFGARGPGRPGTSIRLDDGTSVSGIIIELAPGAVVTGTVSDHLGQPIADAWVGVLRPSFSTTNGQRSLSTVVTGQTDDRGVYRLFGIAPGRYYLSAAIARPGPFREEADLVLPSEADLSRLDSLRQAAPGAAAGYATMASGPTVTYAPVYFPNVTSLAQATVLDLKSGEQRGGIDLQLTLVPTGRIEGAVSYADGPLPSPVQVTLVSASTSDTPISRNYRLGRAGKDGRFEFHGVTPGEYVLAARGNGPAGDGRMATVLWASSTVVVGGGNTALTSLELRRGVSVSGRAVFEDGQAPRSFDGWRIGLTADTPAGEITIGATASEVQPDGSFTVHGVVPGRYRLRATPPAAAKDEWLTKSATLQSQDMLESSVAIAADTTGILVTLTDRVGGISGRLRGAAGTAASDYHVVVFPKDAALWRPLTPRIHTVRPSIDGRYEVPGLPPGEYLIGATIDVEPGEWWDPAFLEQMRSAAFAITLAEGERKVQDLQLRPR